MDGKTANLLVPLASCTNLKIAQSLRVKNVMTARLYEYIAEILAEGQRESMHRLLFYKSVITSGLLINKSLFLLAI